MTNPDVIILPTMHGGMVPTYVEDSLAEMGNLFHSYIEQW